MAIIGKGSTGVQLMAPVAEKAEHLRVFQRTPQSIAPWPDYGRPVEPEVRWLLDHLPGYCNWSRYASTIVLTGWHEDFLVPNPGWEKRGVHI